LPKLFLHIGHPKTGSSAIQVACARSTVQLATHGIHYPHHKSTALALAGQFTAGNVTLTRFLVEYKKAVAETPTDNVLFYSCEGFFNDLATPNSQVAQLNETGVDISILMFLRNPIEYALSLYQQHVKSRGYTQSLSHFMSEFDQMSQTEIVLDRINSMGIPLTLHRFDTNKSRIIELTEQWLRIPEGVLTRLELTVNRSATRAEQSFLREMSTHLGQSSSDHIGRALVNSLPNISQELPALSKTCYHDFVSNIEPQIQRLNAQLPENLHYNITPYETLYTTQPSEDHFVFTQEQINVIVTSLATRTPDAEFATEFVRWVKDINEGDVLSAKDILRLNQLGHILRPGNFPDQRMNRIRNRAQSAQKNDVT